MNSDNFSSQPPEKNVGQKFKSHKDAWNSGKPEYEEHNYLQNGNFNNPNRPFTGIRHVTPGGEPKNFKAPLLQPNIPGQFSFPPRFKTPVSSHFSSEPKLNLKSEKNITENEPPKKNIIKSKWHIDIDEQGSSYGYNKSSSSINQKEKDDEYGFDQPINENFETKKSLLGNSPSDVVQKLPPPKFELESGEILDENEESAQPKPSWVS